MTLLVGLLPGVLGGSGILPAGGVKRFGVWRRWLRGP